MENGGLRGGRDGNAIAAGVLQGVRILIVEDRLDVLHGLERLLRRAGASTRTASTVGEASLALAERIFDLVLLDLNLNGENGIEVARVARDLASPPFVLVLTGDPKYLDVEQLEGLGTRVIMKMNVGRELLGMARSVLDESRPGTVRPVSGAKMRTKGSVRKIRSVAPLSEKERIFVARLDAGEALSIEVVATEILRRGAENEGNENAVQKFVSRLRAKLGELGEDDHVVECVYGGGYRSSRIGAFRRMR